MKTAADYPVTFPYGATTAPYSPTRPHLGEDRAMPTGTPVVVGGMTIGLSGSSGLSTGPHLHIQKISNGKVVNPQGGGFNIKGEVYETGFGDAIGNHVRIREGATQWSYFHLSKINVKVGDKVGSEDEPMFNEGDRVNVNKALFGEDRGFWKNLVEKVTYKQALESILGSPEFRNEQYLNQGDMVNIANGTGWPQEPGIKGWLWKRFWYDYAKNKIVPSEFEPLGKEVYIKK